MSLKVQVTDRRRSKNITVVALAIAAATLALIVLAAACQPVGRRGQTTSEGFPLPVATPRGAAATTAGDDPAARGVSMSTADAGSESRQGWQRLDTTGGGEQTGIAPHPTNPEIVYMASDNGGLLKTENGGDSWFSVSSNLGAYRLSSVTLDPLNPDVVYVTASTDYGKYAASEVTGELYRADAVRPRRNGGSAWELLSGAMGFHSSFPNQVAIAIPYDPEHPERFDRDGDRLSDVLLVGSWADDADPPKGGVWRSDDGGRTFSQIALNDKRVTAVRFVQGSDLVILTTFEGEIYRSPDLGQTWQEITGNLPLPHLADVAIHPEDPNVLYVTCRPCDPGQPPVWMTKDGGKNWQQASRGLDSESSNAFPRILFDRFDPNTLYVTTFDSQRGVYKGTKRAIGGIRWRLMPSTLTLPDGRPYYWLRFQGGLSIAQAIDGRLFAGGGGGWRFPAGSSSSGIPIQDRRQIWEPATIGVSNVHVNTIEIDPLKPTILYQGISDRGPYKSVDGGASFHRILGTGWPVTVNNFKWNGPYYSNYQHCKLDCSAECTGKGQISGGGTTDFAISRQNPAVVYSSFGSGSNRSMHGGVNKSVDGGATWQPLGVQIKDGFDLDPTTCLPFGFRHLAIDPTDDNIVLAVMENPNADAGHPVAILYKTMDGGATWSRVLDTLEAITGVEISAADPTLIVVTTRSDILTSEQGGASGSFERVTPDGKIQIQAIALSPHQAQGMIIGTRLDGIFVTVDGGQSWAHNDLEGFFEQWVSQDNPERLEATVATVVNPEVHVRRHIAAIVFDPVIEDTVYVGGNLRPHAGVGVARVTDQGQRWERLPLDGLTHRNIYALAVDSRGEYLYAGTNDGTLKFKLR